MLTNKWLMTYWLIFNHYAVQGSISWEFRTFSVHQTTVSVVRYYVISENFTYNEVITINYKTKRQIER